MKIGFLGDIHGNLPALRATLDALETEGVDEVVCTGDIIGLLGDPNGVIDELRERDVICIKGNHDTRISDERAFKPVSDFEVFENRFNTSEISLDNDAWLESLPKERIIGIADQDVVIAHSRPDSEHPTGGPVDDPGVLPRNFIGLANRTYDEPKVIALGHTHYQHAVSLDKFDGIDGVVVNPGAVNAPYEDHRDDDGNPIGVASYAVVDTESNTFTLNQVEYDSSQVVDFVDEEHP